jgi:poly-gamma-glutamate capsule biosynthesis protein CapA/YwtB (metallophosphatase superfamily)
MATQDEPTDTGAGVEPQTPAARLRGPTAPPEGGPAPAEPEGSAALTPTPAAARSARGHRSRPAERKTAPAPGSRRVWSPETPRRPRPGRTGRTATTVWAPPGSRARSADTVWAPPRSGTRAWTNRAAALLALGSAVGFLVFLLLSQGSSSSLPGLGELDAEPSSRVVAPGGRLSVVGSDAPGRAKVQLETRFDGGPWRTAGWSYSNGDGDFEVEGRAIARPGRLVVRARAPAAGASTPVALTVRPLRLASVGDINLGDAPGQAIAANGPRYPWTSVGKRLRAADIAFGNLECAISKRGLPFPKQFTFRGTPEALRGLRRASGMDVLNLANNHVGDYGQQAMLDTVRFVERHGMHAVGAGPNLRRALAPQVVERLGLRVAFVGFSQIAPLEFAAGERSPGTAWATTDAVVAAVRRARKRADVVVATFHWGIEKAPFESAEQRTLAEAAVSAGAHLVIGAHPHVLQPVRREGAALVAYSLGNFVFGAASSDTTSTGILETDLTAEGVTAARWRGGRIVNGRPVLDRRPPRRLPLDDPAKMAGVSL